MKYVHRIKKYRCKITSLTLIVPFMFVWLHHLWQRLTKVGVECEVWILHTCPYRSSFILNTRKLFILHVHFENFFGQYSIPWDPQYVKSTSRRSCSVSLPPAFPAPVDSLQLSCFCALMSLFVTLSLERTLESKLATFQENPPLDSVLCSSWLWLVMLAKHFQTNRRSPQVEFCLYMQHCLSSTGFVNKWENALTVAANL